MEAPPTNITKALRREIVRRTPILHHCSSIAESRLRFRRVAFLPRLLSHFFLEQFAEPGARLVQLRL
jgi:hypothetical protein